MLRREVGGIAEESIFAVCGNIAVAIDTDLVRHREESRFPSVVDVALAALHRIQLMCALGDCDVGRRIGMTSRAFTRGSRLEADMASAAFAREVHMVGCDGSGHPCELASRR